MNTSWQQVAVEPLDCLSKAKELISDQYWLWVGVTALGMIIGTVVPLGILLGPMMCGIYFCYLAKMKGTPLTFENLFKGFDYFKESLIVTLILVGLSLLVIIPLYVVIFAGVIGIGVAGHGAQGLTAVIMGAGMLVIYAVMIFFSIIVAVFFMFVYPLIVDRKLTAVEAWKTSFSAGWEHFGGLCALIAINFIIGFIATLCCYVPVFFVGPLLLGSVAVAYRKIFPAIADDADGMAEAPAR